MTKITQSSFERNLSPETAKLLIENKDSIIGEPITGDDFLAEMGSIHRTHNPIVEKQCS